MSYVLATPELISAAATDLAAIGSTLDAAHQAATNPTTALVPAAADEVSVGVAHVFSAQAQQFQGLAGKAAAFHDQFVQHLTASAGAYASAEAANVSLLQQLPANLNGFVSTLATTQPELLFLFLILLSLAIALLLPAIVIPLLAVGLPLAFAVGLPLGIAALAYLFGPIILFALLGQLGAVL
jgi:hypothetical protein